MVPEGSGRRSVDKEAYLRIWGTLPTDGLDLAGVRPTTPPDSDLGTEVAVPFEPAGPVAPPTPAGRDEISGSIEPLLARVGAILERLERAQSRIERDLGEFVGRMETRPDAHPARERGEDDGRLEPRGVVRPGLRHGRHSNRSQGLVSAIAVFALACISALAVTGAGADFDPLVVTARDVLLGVMTGLVAFVIGTVVRRGIARRHPQGEAEAGR